MGGRRKKHVMRGGNGGDIIGLLSEQSELFMVITKLQKVYLLTLNMVFSTKI